MFGPDLGREVCVGVHCWLGWRWGRKCYEDQTWSKYVELAGAHVMPMSLSFGSHMEHHRIKVLSERGLMGGSHYVTLPENAKMGNEVVLRGGLHQIIEQSVNSIRAKNDEREEEQHFKRS